MRLRNKNGIITYASIMSVALLVACASPPGIPAPGLQSTSQSGFIHEYEDFVVVKIIEGDSLKDLAAKFLGDPSKIWIIKEFNNIEVLTPGDEIIIPLKPVHLGGLKSNGFQKVPILLYHDFTRTRSSKMKVLESSFEAQMKFLKENDYNVITLDRFLNFMEYKEPLPEKSVVITIDDGWKSFYTIAYPILRKYNFPATLFVYTDFIGGKKALTWNQIKELAEYGFDIQCHTRTHRYLTRIEDGETFHQFFESVDEELIYPKKLLKKRINRDCDCLAYPYGKTNSLVAAMLKKHGYRAAFTVTRGGNPFYLNNYNLNRSAIYGHYDLEKFKKNLDVFQPMAAVYETAGDLQKAHYLLNIAAKVSPGDKQISTKLAELKRHMEAKADFHFKAGVELYRNQQLEKSRLAFLKTLLYNPHHPEALIYLEEKFSPFKTVLYTAKKGEKKKDIARKIFKSADKAFLISYFAPETGDREFLKKELRMELPYLEMAPAKHKAKPTQQSTETASIYQIKKSSPPAFNIQTELAKANEYLKTKQYDNVLTVADTIFEHDNFSKEAEGLINQVYFQKGNDLFRAKRYVEARTYLSFIDPDYISTQEIQAKIKTILDKQAEAQYLKGVNFFINEDLENAIVAWETVLKLNPDHEKAKADILTAKQLLEKLQNLD